MAREGLNLDNVMTDIQQFGDFTCTQLNTLPFPVHRIGRTGRSGKTGIATTFINQNCSEQIRLDLKHLLREAKQRVPPFLEALEDPSEKLGLAGGKC